MRIFRLLQPTLFYLVVAVALPCLYAGDSLAVTLSGNSATSPAYLESLLDRCLARADEEKPTDKNAFLSQCLMNSRLFSKVDVEDTEKGQKVTVKERWTLLPLPYLSTDQDGDFMGGLLLAESNFLGRGLHVVAMGMYSKDAQSYFLSYRDPSVAFSNWSMGVWGGGGDSETPYREKDEEKFVEEVTTIYGGVTVGYRYKRYQADLSAGYKTLSYRGHEDYKSPDDYEAGLLDLRGRYEGADYLFFFEKGLTAQAIGSQELGRSDGNRSVTSVKLNLDYGLPVFTDHSLQLKFSGGWADTNLLTGTEKLGGKPCFRGIDNQTAWADLYGAVAVDYQIPVANFNMGTWTVGGFLDGGILRNRFGDDETIPFVAGGVGTWFYMKSVAMPGLGFIIGSNTPYNGFFSTFTVGYGF